MPETVAKPSTVRFYQVVGIPLKKPPRDPLTLGNFQGESVGERFSNTCIGHSERIRLPLLSCINFGYEAHTHR